MRTSIVFCNSASADRSAMAASRLPAAAAASGILFYVLRLKVINCIAVAAGKLRMVPWIALATNFLSFWRW